MGGWVWDTVGHLQHFFFKKLQMPNNCPMGRMSEVESTEQGVCSQIQSVIIDMCK